MFDVVEKQASGDRLVDTGGVGASDRERETVLGVLHQAFAEGRLTLEDIDERTAAIYAARFRQELELLIADLPATTTSDAPAGWLAVWNGVVRQSRVMLLGAVPDTDSGPTPSQHVRGALVALTLLIWLAVWVLIGFTGGMFL